MKLVFSGSHLIINGRPYHGYSSCTSANISDLRELIAKGLGVPELKHLELNVQLINRKGESDAGS